MSLIAHQVELSGEIGATLHIEPTDNPSAGEPTTAWFALVRQGGQTVPLADCDCQLAIYALPRESGDAPVAQPDLSPITAEGFEAIPAAEVTFPTVGEYELLLIGAPQNGADFEPFTLSYQVLVARGSAAAALPAEELDVSRANPGANPGANPDMAPAASVPFVAIAAVLAVLAAIAGIIYAVRAARNKPPSGAD